MRCEPRANGKFASIAIAATLLCAACSDDSAKKSDESQDAGNVAHDGSVQNLDASAPALDASADAHTASDAALHDAGGGSTANLIVNGNAEAAPGSTDGTAVATPPWTVTGEATALAYGTGNYPSRAEVGTPDPGPADRGNNLFIGGQDDEVSTLTQTISLASYTAAIDSGAVQFALAGWLGGFSSQGDNAKLDITFQDGLGATLSTATIGPVTPDDRMNTTSLLERTTSGAVPKNARSVVVLLTATRTEGSANDGYADDLSLSLAGI